jgi:hypothetical protein
MKAKIVLVVYIVVGLIFVGTGLSMVNQEPQPLNKEKVYKLKGNEPVSDKKVVLSMLNAVHTFEACIGNTGLATA